LFLCKVLPLMSPQGNDPYGFKLELNPLFKDTKKEDVLKGMLDCSNVYNLDFENPEMRSRYEHQSTKWRACKACPYYNKCFNE